MGRLIAEGEQHGLLEKELQAAKSILTNGGVRTRSHLSLTDTTGKTQLFSPRGDGGSNINFDNDFVKAVFEDVQNVWLPRFNSSLQEQLSQTIDFSVKTAVAKATEELKEA